MPLLGKPSEFIDALSSGECHVRGCGLPVWDSNVALFVRTAPAFDAAIFANAADDPVRGPLALYTAGNMMRQKKEEEKLI
jgi:hypothetical protein